VNPITSLQNNGVKFPWTQKCEDRFQLMKELLTCVPILQIVDPDKEYMVCIDASLEGLGGFLMQEVCVVCYESRKLKVHENNYATHDLELTPKVHAIKMWRHYQT